MFHSPLRHLTPYIISFLNFLVKIHYRIFAPRKPLNVKRLALVHSYLELIYEYH